jgi:hypothetical protein
MTGFKKRNYLPHSVHSIISEFYNIAQGKRSNQEFYDEFNNLIAAVDECGASLGKHPTIYREVISEIAQDDTNPTPEEKQRHRVSQEDDTLQWPSYLGPIGTGMAFY